MNENNFEETTTGGSILDVDTTINLVNVLTVVLILFVVVLGYLLIRKRE